MTSPTSPTPPTSPVGEYAGHERPGPAKRPLTPLAGPYGHPFHPILVTVPIGAWTLSLVFDLVSRWSGEPEVFVKASFWLMGAGILPGPFARADAQGLVDVLEALERAESEWGEGFTPPLILRRLVAQGRLGQKSGQGFFP